MDEPDKADERPDRAPAYKDGRKPGPRDANVQIRPAGPDSMKDKPAQWDKVDE